MALVTTGEISIGGNATSGGRNRSINIELGRAAGATSNLNETALRTLAGVSSGAISLANFYDKSNITFSLASLIDIVGTANPGDTAFAEHRFETNGTMTYGTNSTFSTSMGNWASPTTTGIGSSYWIRFTQTSSGGVSTETGSSRGVWHQLSSQRIFGLSKVNNGFAFRIYTVEISSDSGGSTIVASKTGVRIDVEIVF
jgi:hypothetical protein